MKRNPLSITILLTLCVVLSACNSATPVPPTPSATLVPSTPTPTEEPMALKVNDEGITMVEYQTELTRLQTSQSNLGTTATADEQRNRVIENFTDLLLLEQAAQKSGYSVDDAALKSRLDSLATSMGGTDALSAWETTNGYTAETFQTALKREIYADYQRDQIINSVPETADQVHARQILVQDKVNADSLLAQLKAGKDFATLASTLDPTTGGDLGWFPQGYLTQSAVEQAAFSLEPGQYSDIIQSDLGYHIIYVIERDANHPLSVDARRTLQENKLSQWLKDQKTASQIQVLVQ
jgi:peptidyl-prolyl cis-trans isomerase C